jgi:hypothetical protein
VLDALKMAGQRRARDVSIIRTEAGQSQSHKSTIGKWLRQLGPTRPIKLPPFPTTVTDVIYQTESSRLSYQFGRCRAGMVGASQYASTYSSAK